MAIAYCVTPYGEVVERALTIQEITARRDAEIAAETRYELRIIRQRGEGLDPEVVELRGVMGDLSIELVCDDGESQWGTVIGGAELGAKSFDAREIGEQLFATTEYGAE